MGLTHAATATPDLHAAQPLMAAERPSPRLSLADLRAALRGGWDDFVALPKHNLLLAAIYPAVGVAAAQTASGAGLLPVMLPLAAGFALVGPLAPVGFYEIARRREAGEPARWRDAFGAASGGRGAALLQVGLLLAGLFCVWIGVAQAVFAATLAPTAPEAALDLLAMALTTPEGWRMLGFGAAALALGLGVFSLPLIVDGETRARRALALSMRATLANPGALALWGAMAGAASLVSIVMGVAGLAVALPVFAHGTWRLHRRAFPKAADAA